jgi:gliding motility-associated-like protein
VTCHGGNNGAITLIVSGGNYPYTYKYPPSTGVTDSFGTTFTAGNYTPIITDATGCSDTLKVTISQPSQILPSLVLLDSITCFGANNGEVVIAAIGGVPPYIYALDGSGTYQASDTFSLLTPGAHTVTVRDSHLCDSVLAFTIYQPAALTAAVGLTREATCNGTCNGAILLNITGGTSPFSLSTNGGTLYTPGDSLSALCAATYNITVKDAKGCTYTLVDSITQPPLLALSLTSTAPVTCYTTADGQVTVSATGGVPAYSYSLNHGTPQASGTFTTATESNDTVTVTDAHGCSAILPVTTVGGPPAIAADTLYTVQNTCYDSSDGRIVLAPTSGGTAPYTYAWPQVAGDQADSATGLAPGTYQVVITDAHGCSDTITTILTPAVQPVLTILPLDTTITLGDTIQLNSQFGPASLGTPTYTWIDTTHMLSCLTCPAPLTSPTDSVNTYILIATYNNHCAVSVTDIIKVSQLDTFVIPTAFTPNGDGKNDTYYIIPGNANDVKSFHMDIYSRWGELVFTTDNINGQWDGTFKGKPQPSEIYTIYFNIEYGKNKSASRTASISLLR